jgi:hypothetical protein
LLQAASSAGGCVFADVSRLKVCSRHDWRCTRVLRCTCVLLTSRLAISFNQLLPCTVAAMHSSITLYHHSRQHTLPSLHNTLNTTGHCQQHKR